MKKNIFNLILLLAILCGFNSCVDKPLDPIDNPEYTLCNNAGWWDEYHDVDGYYCEQRLISIVMAEEKKALFAITAISPVISKNLNMISIGNGTMTTMDLSIWNIPMETTSYLTICAYTLMNYPVI